LWTRKVPIRNLVPGLPRGLCDLLRDFGERLYHLLGPDQNPGKPPSQRVLHQLCLKPVQERPEDLYGLPRRLCHLHRRSHRERLCDLRGE
jgi:hypothetical protein